jgi:hypothetical protein
MAERSVQRSLNGEEDECARRQDLLIERECNKETNDERLSLQ